MSSTQVDWRSLCSASQRCAWHFAAMAFVSFAHPANSLRPWCSVSQLGAGYLSFGLSISSACCLMSLLALCGHRSGSFPVAGGSALHLCTGRLAVESTASLCSLGFNLPHYAQHSIFVLGAWQWSPQHRSACLASFCLVYLFSGSSVLEHFMRFSARRRGADIVGIGAPSVCCALGSGVLHFCSARLASACSPMLFKG